MRVTVKVVATDSTVSALSGCQCASRYLSTVTTTAVTMLCSFSLPQRCAHRCLTTVGYLLSIVYKESLTLFLLPQLQIGKKNMFKRYEIYFYQFCLSTSFKLNSTIPTNNYLNGSISFPFLLNHLPPRQRYGEESWSVLKYLLSNFSGLLGHIAVIPINRHGFKG